MITWVFKPIGWTPKDCIVELKSLKSNYELYPDYEHTNYEHKNYEHTKMGFAGRLDPMAYGLLPIVIQDNKNQTKDELQGSYKTYQFKIIPGLLSDTYDILGIVNICEVVDLDLDKIKTMNSQKYPPYSSYCVFDAHYQKKVPLWKLVKENRLPDILPEREVDIRNIEIIKSEMIKNSDLLNLIKIRIDKLRNKEGFRYETILNCWNNLDLNNQYKVYHLESTVSSGTYIRSIANSLGAVAYDIFRIKVKDNVLKNHENYDPFKFTIIK